MRAGQDRARFVALGDHLEHQVRLSPYVGLVADFVDDENSGPEVGAELAVEPAGGSGDLEPADHVVESREVDRESGPAGGNRESDRDLGLADPARYQRFALRFGMSQLHVTFVRSM